MSLTGTVIALLEGLEPSAVQDLPPASRRRFAELCRHWAKIADPPEPPRPGVLSELEKGARHD